MSWQVHYNLFLAGKCFTDKVSDSKIRNYPWSRVAPQFLNSFCGVSVNLNLLPPCFALKFDSPIPVFALAPLLALNKHLLIFPTQVFALFQLGEAATPAHSGVRVLLKRMLEWSRTFAVFDLLAARPEHSFLCVCSVSLMRCPGLASGFLI